MTSISAGANCCFDFTALDHLLASVIDAGKVLSDQLNGFLLSHNDSIANHTAADRPEHVLRRIILPCSSMPLVIKGG
jgi:hypothetical protein